jgi:putative ABC transport system permease protein
MEFGPIWRAMMRSKGGYILIALQIAVTMAIMVNAIAIMQERGSKMARPSGLDEANTFAFVSVGFASDMNNKALINEDLDTLRNLPGVKHVTASNSFPLRQGGWSEGLHREPGVGKSVSSSAIYFVDEHGLDTFGLELIDGENFAPEQVGWDSDTDDPWPATVIVSQALGEHLFPDHEGSFVGKTFYFNDDNPAKIVGVVKTLQAPWQSWPGVERSMLVPQRRDGEFARYIVRTEPGYRDELMVKAEELLANSDRDRIIRSMATMDEVRKLAYLGDAAMIKILTFVVALLTAITGLGLVGLASFSVARKFRGQQHWHRGGRHPRSRFEHLHGAGVFTDAAGLVRDPDRDGCAVDRRTAGRCRPCPKGKQHIPCDSYAIRLGIRAQKGENQGLAPMLQRQST